MTPDATCWLYFAVSPIAAAAIVWFGVGSTKGGGDYCDPVYTSVAERDADFRAASLFIATASAVMLAIGVAAAVMLVARRHTLRRGRGARVASGLAAVGVAMIGYVLLLVIGTDFVSDCGGIRL